MDVLDPRNRWGGGRGVVLGVQHFHRSLVFVVQHVECVCVCVCVCVNSCFKGALSHCCIVQQGGSRVCLFFCWTCFVHVTAPITVQHLEVDKLIDERKDYARHWALPSPSSTLGPGRCNSSGPTDWVTMKPHVGEDMERPYSNKHGSGPLLP